MKNRIFLLIISSFLHSYSLFSQEKIDTITDRSDLYKQSKRLVYFFSDDLLIGPETYWLACKDTVRNGQKKIKFYLYKEDISKGFEMTKIEPSENSINIFQTEFKKAFIKLNTSCINDTFKIDSELEDQIKISATQYLFKLYANIINDTTDISLIVGELKANHTVQYYLNESPEKEKQHKEMIVDSVKIKFEEEQIVDIKVTGYINKSDKKLLFQNRIPISYSTKADVSNDLGVNRAIKLFDPQDSFYIKMHDVFTNDYKLLNKTENYSPKDQVITIIPGENGKVIMKEKGTDLFLAEVYSDILGLNSSQPNGLIQTEVSKRIYLNRRSYILGNKNAYWGFTNCVNPHITISKIEENNKYLEPEYYNGTLHVNIIDLFKYTSWQTGGEINLIYLGWPRMHSIFYFNAGFYFMNIPLRLPELEEGQKYNEFHDITVNEEDNTINTNITSLFPEINWIISPHSNLSIAYQAKWNFILNPSKDIIVENGCSVLSLRFVASLKLNNNADGQIFFRSYYNFSSKYRAYNFLQNQIGYSFNITSASLKN
jgi:hypothetical protein